jgi:hypothetical protein
MSDAIDNAKLSKIDAAIAAAKARKAAREAQESEEGTSSSQENSVKKVKLSAEERAKKKEAILVERAARKAAQLVEREAKRAAKASAGEKPTRISKVDRAGAKLPRLLDTAQAIFEDITVNLGAEQLAALAQHILHHNRVKSTERAQGAKLEVGQRVRITGGDPKWYGVHGTLSKVQRIRCFVEVPGANKPVYLFTSDVEPIADDVPRTGTEG